VSACQFNQLIYCFGGVSEANSKYHNTIEFMDCSSINHQDFNSEIEKHNLFHLEWEVIEPKNPSSVLFGYNFGCAQLNTSQIIVFGGNIQDFENIHNRTKTTRSTMIFNVRDNSIKYINGNEEETKFFDLETDKYCINEKDTFYHNDCVVYKNKIFCHGKESFHVFDMNSYSWK